MLIRHCASCGREIEVSLPYSKQYVYYQKKWYCKDCFIANTTKRIQSNDWYSKTEDFVEEAVSKDNIDRLFKKHYDVSLIPQYIYVKLDSIYKGTYKGQAEPITPYELLDILERKMDYLDKNAANKKLSGISRINYDLAVAIGSYKSYKEWKSAMAAEQEQTEQEMKDDQTFRYLLNRRVSIPQVVEDNNFIDFDEEE